MLQTRPPVIPAEVRRMYFRVLAPWAQDLLELRRQGLLRPGYRPADAIHAPARPLARAA